MSIVFYLIAAMAAVYAVISLTGRDIRSGKGRGKFLQKIDRDDPYRRSKMISGFITHIIAALAGLAFGLHEDGLLDLPESATFELSIAFLGIIVMVIIYTLIKTRRVDRKPAKGKRSIQMGTIRVIYGSTTPQIFDGSDYRVAYETMVQEPEVPFVTCELQTVEDGRYIGDLIFEASKSELHADDLRLTPILQVHLDK